MLYVVAMVISPLAIWLCGRPLRALLNLGLSIVAFALTLAGFGVAVLVPLLDAVMVVHGFYADQHLERMVQELHEAHRGRGGAMSSVQIVRFPDSRTGSGGAAA